MIQQLKGLFLQAFFVDYSFPLRDLFDQSKTIAIVWQVPSIDANAVG